VLRSSTTSYYEADGLGLSLAQQRGWSIGADLHVRLVWKSDSVHSSITNPLRYTAREFESETNLYFYRADTMILRQVASSAKTLFTSFGEECVPVCKQQPISSGRPDWLSRAPLL